MLIDVARRCTGGRSWLPTSSTTGIPASATRLMRRANSRWNVGFGSRILYASPANTKTSTPSSIA